MNDETNENETAEETPVVAKPMGVQYEKNANAKKKTQKVNEGFNKAHRAKYAKRVLK